MKSNDKNIGGLIRTMRKERGITQKELGEIIGVSERVVGYYETDNRFPKDKEVIVRIAEYFDVSLDYLLQTSDIKKTYKEPEQKSDDPVQTTIKLLSKGGSNMKRQDDLQHIIDMVRAYCNEYGIRDCDENAMISSLYNMGARKREVVYEVKVEISVENNKKGLISSVNSPGVTICRI